MLQWLQTLGEAAVKHYGMQYSILKACFTKANVSHHVAGKQPQLSPMKHSTKRM